MSYGLHFRLSVIIALLAITPLILVGALVGQRSVASLKRHSYAMERGLVARVGIEIRGVIEGWEHQLRLLDGVQGLEMLEPAEQRSIMSNLMQHERLLQEIALLNLEGQEQIRLSRSNVILADDLKSRAGSDVFDYPYSGNGTYFGLRFDEDIQEQLLTISIPLVDLRTGGITSILVADFRYKMIEELLAESAFPNGVDVFVVDPAGRVVAHRNPSKVLSKTMLDNSRHAGTTKGLSGMDVLVAEERLRFGNQEMVVVAEQPVDLAYQLANESIRILVIVTSVVLAVAIVVAALVARQIVRPIKALATSALAVSSGDLSRQVEVGSRDEVGQFATAFNEMVNRLRESRETLQESERHYRLLADNVAAIMSDGIWIRDLVDLHPVYFSPSIESLSSATVGEAMVQTTEESFTPATIESTKTAIEAQLALESVEGHDPGWSHTLEYEMVRKDSSIVWIETKMSFLRDPDGRPEALVGVTRDITERKQAEQKLAQQAQELSRSNQELEQFAHIASHDLQEPLRMVSSYTQLLERRYKDKIDTDANEFIGYAVDGARRMQAQINDLLAYSRITTRGNPFEPTDCEGIFEQAVSNLAAAIEESGAVVTRDPLPTLMADASQLVSSFQNLIGNGIKYHGDQPPLIHVSAVECGQEWMFSFSDNGIGIDAEYAERIFVIFQRLHGKTEYPGTGIGLSLGGGAAWRSHLGRVRARQGQHLLLHITNGGTTREGP